MSTTCGTPGYVAPEILEQKGYGKEVDLWSIGVILYILLCGFPPFYDDNNSLLFMAIKKADYSFPSPYWDKVSKPAIDLIQKLLQVDPSKRLTIDEAMKHPWISGKDDQSSENLASAQEQLKKFNAKKKLKNAINSVLAVSFLHFRVLLQRSDFHLLLGIADELDRMAGESHQQNGAVLFRCEVNGSFETRKVK